MSYQWHGGRPHAWPGHHANAMMRASHTDRERAADVLKAGFAEGRLTKDEYERRVTAAYQAMTYGELQSLIADLPQGPVPMAYGPAMSPAVPPTFRPFPPPSTNSSAVAALICGVLTPMTWGATAIPAVVLGHKARAEVRRTGEGGDGMAVGGLVIGYLGLVFGTLFLLFLIGVASA